jgi:hypothetical protein
MPVLRHREKKPAGGAAELAEHFGWVQAAVPRFPCVAANRRRARQRAPRLRGGHPWGAHIQAHPPHPPALTPLP